MSISMEVQLARVLGAAQKLLRAPSASSSVLAEVNNALDRFLSESSRQLQFEDCLSTSPVVNEAVETIVRLLSVPNLPTGSLARVLSLLNILLRSCEGDVKQVLLQKQTMALLATVLHSGREPVTTECLKLLQQLTYASCDPTHHNRMAMERLIKYTTGSLLSHDTSPTHLLLCLEVLTNLCTTNVSVKATLKGMSHFESLQRKLISLLSDKSVSVIVAALHLLAVLCLNDQLGKKVFKSDNIEQSFQLCLSIVCTSHDRSAVWHANELLKELLTVDEFCRSFAEYSQLTVCLQKVAQRLLNVEKPIALLILQFCTILCQTQCLRCHLVKVLFTPLPTAKRRQATSSSQSILLASILSMAQVSHPQLSVTALELLLDIIKETISSSLVVHLIPALPSIMTVIVGGLSAPNYTLGETAVLTTLSRVHWTIKLTSLLLDIEECVQTVLHALDLSKLSSLIEDQLRNNPVCSEVAITKEWSSNGVIVVVMALDLLCKHRKYRHFEGLLHKHLQDPNVLPLLAEALHTHDQSMLESAMCLVMEACSLDHTLMLSLCGAMVASNKSLSSSQGVMDQSSDAHLAAGAPASLGSASDDSHTPLQSVQLNRDLPLPKLDQGSLNSLIEKFRAGLKVSDARSSEIMSVYEYKLQTMASKENHLQDLLEAKALALSQADRLIGEYRSKRTQVDKECLKLRALLQETEKECEILRDKVSSLESCEQELTAEIERLRCDNAQLLNIAEEHSQLRVAFTNQTTRLESLEMTLTSLTHERDSLSENKAFLEQKIQELEAELIKTMNELQTRNKELSECSNHLQSLTKEHEELKRQYSQTVAERNVLQSEKASLSKELQEQKNRGNALEKRNTILASQVKDLEQCKERLQTESMQLQQNLQRLREQNAQLLKEVNLFSAVKNLISTGALQTE